MTAVFVERHTLHNDTLPRNGTVAFEYEVGPINVTVLGFGLLDGNTSILVKEDNGTIHNISPERLHPL